MSEEFKIFAVGKMGFVAPFQMVGLGGSEADSLDGAREFIMGSALDSTLFLLDEDLAGDASAIEEMEEAGANIIILKGWGESGKAGRKIRAASIKAIGTEIF